MCYDVYMLQRQNRLKKKVDFDTVYERGRFVRGTYITMKVWHVVPDIYPKRAYSKCDLKIAFVVSKKVHKSAVKRNRVKRQMREAVRLLVKEGKLRKGNMVILMASPEIIDVSYELIAEDIQKVFKGGKIL